MGKKERGKREERREKETAEKRWSFWRCDAQYTKYTQYINPSVYSVAVELLEEHRRRYETECIVKNRISLSLSLSLSHTHTHTQSLSLSYTIPHTLSLFLSVIRLSSFISSSCHHLSSSSLRPFFVSASQQSPPLHPPPLHPPLLIFLRLLHSSAVRLTLKRGVGKEEEERGLLSRCSAPSHGQHRERGGRGEQHH